MNTGDEGHPCVMYPSRPGAQTCLICSLISLSVSRIWETPLFMNYEKLMRMTVNVY